MTSEAFARRITEMTPTLYRVACSYLRQPSDREDAVQEALRKAWEKRHTLREERYLQTWVVRILINECRMLCRRSARMVPVKEVRAASGDEALLREALFSLEEKLRTPILLHYIEGYTTEEAGRILHVPVGTVRSRLKKARELMKEALSEA